MADHVYKPSEVPKGQRWQHFLDYYKTPFIVGVLLIIAAIFILRTIVFAPEKDVTILMASEQYIDYEITGSLNEDFQSMPLDFDGDGEVLISFDFVHLDPTAQPQDPEYYKAQQMKLMAVLSSATTALQVVDEALYEYLAEEELIGTYGELSDTYGHPPEEAIKIPLKELRPFSKHQTLPDGLFMTLRPKEAMLLGNSEKKLEKYYTQVEALELMIQ